MEEQPQSARSGSGGKPPRIAVDLEDSKSHRHRMIPVWFFVGIILLIYGLIIVATGISELKSPPPTVLSDLHPALWWGGILTLLGGIYVYTYIPRQ